MPQSSQRPALETYLAEVAKLRTLPVDQLQEEVDQLAPIWVPLKVVPEV